MAKVIVQTDDGRQVTSIFVSDQAAGTATWLKLIGRPERPLGGLGRALDDAAIIQAGGDPERLSEKAMRLSAEQREALAKQIPHE